METFPCDRVVHIYYGIVVTHFRIWSRILHDVGSAAVSTHPGYDERDTQPSGAQYSIPSQGDHGYHNH